MFDLKEYLTNLMGGGNTSTPKQSLSPMQNPRDPASRGYAPEITYNPNPNTNIPYSARSMEDAQLGNEYMANPRDPKFLGVDPKRFGFAPDIAPQRPSEYGFGAYSDGNIHSVGGRGFGYGGTVGVGNGKPFANMNRNGQPTDPLKELRRILGY